MRQIFVLFFIFPIILSSNRWPNHDISTLKLLQIVHRHGDRGPSSFSPNDPFKNESYWSEGIGELTSKGKYRMYKLGQFIRQEYSSYLGEDYSPREVYARSALKDRCVESLSCLLSGAYPPKQKTWKWNEGSDAELGSVWQPFPIQTVMPETDDVVLSEARPCDAENREILKIENRTVIKQFNAEYQEFYQNISRITGTNITSLFDAGIVYDELRIELDYKYIWSDFWTEEEMTKVVERLSPSQTMVFRYLWDSPITKRLRAGGLIRELNKNLQKVMDYQNDKKLYVYSTHDSQLAALMHAIDIFNIKLPTFGAALFLELHHDTSKVVNNGYFVRVFYHNETVINSGTPHSLPLTNCQNLFDCPIDEFFNSTKHLLYDNFDKECKQ